MKTKIGGIFVAWGSEAIRALYMWPNKSIAWPSEKGGFSLTKK